MLNINKYDDTMMQTAMLWSKQSTDIKHKVGCAISINNHLVATGYNGTKPGAKNITRDENNETNQCVIHAEINAITSLNNTISVTSRSKTLRLYVTHAPCIRCAEVIAARGIHEVIYGRITSSGYEGLAYLDTKSRIRVKQI